MAEHLYKYHGLGNDFVVLDRRASQRDIEAETARRFCDRRRGIGADGVLVLLPAANAWARMVVHNADGSVAEMCGNGLRCVVKFLVDHAASRPDVVPVQTGSGLLRCAVQYEGERVSRVEVSMGPALLFAKHLPATEEGRFVHRELEGFPGVRGTAISMGNPHLVLWELALSEVGTLGPQLERAPGFAERTNVEFARLQGSEIEVVVWERGVGLTQACGTGACAVAASAVLEGKLAAGQWIPVHLPGGQLEVLVEADLSSVLLRGPATFVFEADVPEL